MTPLFFRRRLRLGTLWLRDGDDGALAKLVCECRLEDGVHPHPNLASRVDLGRPDAATSWFFVFFPGPTEQPYGCGCQNQWDPILG